MALLQIAEPGQSPQPHQRRLAVGIDLGTTNSLVAALRSGRSEPLPDAQGNVILPSAVRYLEGRNEVLDIPVSNLEIGNLPQAPDGMEIAHVDVIIRLREKRA